MTHDEQARALYRVIGQRIARAREATSPPLTQEALAGKTGHRLSRSSIASLESGRQSITIYQLYHLAEALSQRPFALLPDPEEIQVGERPLAGTDTLEPSERKFLLKLRERPGQQRLLQDPAE